MKSDYRDWDYQDLIEDDDSGCCSCCCNCWQADEDTDYTPTPPEPYQLWLFAELAPKDFSDILKRYYVGPINDMLNQSSILFKVLGQFPTPAEYAAMEHREPSQPYLYGV